MEQRIALVTGGARGIGKAIVEAPARDGMFVAVGDLLADTAEETVAAITADGGRGAALALDVAASDSVRAAVAQIEREHGPIDVLVNNAGWDDFMPFVESDEAFWQKIIEINYKGVLRTTHAVLPGMMEMKRLGQPHEVAAAVSFFASERAGFTTGQTLSVSGGLTMA